ncbi:ATP-binding cassette sub-family A member 8-B [Grammomys surdaster]|uniref:ATP-binding cassette sub-family A member 8-B n=1 Tax=Grammomys surdaster TaxID=491861 RepID=UPI0010A05D15|nr:ATP-binding cassette sub-family A member 8-B [Grammomys surdaster]
MIKREISVHQQTCALLKKNLLKKWRLRRETLMECVSSLVLLIFLILYHHGHEATDFSSVPTKDLGRVDSFRQSGFTIGYMPVTSMTQQIMEKVAAAPFMSGRKVLGLLDEEHIKELTENHAEIIRVIFSDTFSYHLKFRFGQRIPKSREFRDHEAHCEGMYEDVYCLISIFWEEGFVALQAAINAAIIETTTNHSVMEELLSVSGKYMKVHPFVSQGGILTDFFIFTCIISFSPITYYVSINVTRERKRMKGLMMMMGLQDPAFWLSWGLLYAGFVFIMALFLALVIKYVEFLILTSFMVVFSLFLLYGLSMIALAFLISILVRKSVLTGLTVFLLTIFWGSLGFTALYRYLPAPLEWTLSLFSPFAFTLGMAQLLHVDHDLNSNAPPDPDGGSNRIIATNFMLAFDTFLYLALMMYFEKVLPNEYGHQHSPLFFLKSSFWLRPQKPAHVILEDGIDSDPSSDGSFEPVSPEFHGKESIRIRNISKEYKGKPNKIEALKDLTLDIYEGQITAILGHSGAGKSTLLNILSGLSVPTKGSVTIYNNKLSEMADLENVFRIVGVCPQSNVQFDFLTVRENLRLFAKIRGIPPQDVEKEVQRVLLELEMENIQDILAQNLSGGQKRKLTFGITILGDSQIFLLDEPTAGLDPFSRHRVWNLLKERKADRVVLFSTQFMDEADILADRKVFISKGKLKCAGSSLFLKKKWGIGYHLTLQLKEVCVPENITSLVKQHIPEAKLSAEGEGKLVYTLPLETTYRFPELCQSLDSCPGLGIENYGVSMTTLNEVFLKLEGKAAIDEPEVDIMGGGQTERSGDAERLIEMEQTLSSVTETEKKMDGMALWRQQTCAIAKVRLLKLKHERKKLLSVLLILAVGICPLLFESITMKILQSTYTWELSPHEYFLAPGQQPQGMLTRLLIINKTEASIDDFIHSVERQNIALEVDASGARDGTDDPSYNGAIIVSGNEKDHSFSFACNTKRLNCFPVLMDILSNGLLGMVKPSARIRTDRSTYFENRIAAPFEYLGKTAFWLTLISACPPYIAMSSITDYKNKAWFQLRVSGLFPSAYWFGQALVDIPLYCFVFLFMSLMDYLLRFPDNKFSIISHVIQIPCSVGYAISLIFLTYVISFISRKGKKNSGIWSLGFYIITMFSVLAMLLDFTGGGILYSIIFLIPPSTLIGCLILSMHLIIYRVFEEAPLVEPFLVFLVPFLHVFVLIFTLRCLEWKCGKKTMRKDPIFRISPRNNDVYQNPEKPDNDDEDVQMERIRTANALVSTSFDEKPVIVASCLRKEYAEKRKHCLSKKKAKIATRNVSFCVRKGEILGLLGHNGAGKSTSLKMISGDIKFTAGQVLLKGSGEGDTLEFLGYCPQENALWPNLTVREHLEVFAAVKGLSRSHAAVSITRLVDALKLQDQLKSPVKTLSEGVKRKLCFVLSILGSPSILLLDEPSTGLDPEGQQQIWQAIRSIIKNTDRAALLTTHYMAEAEALCDRVAILVSGRLRCIGSIQHLKSKFGKDYLLEMKVKSLEQVEPLNTEVLRLFPQAARQERYSSLMVYKLPVEAVQPLSQAFFKLEKVKQTFDLEEYSLSQSTLEQVFLELSKEQELDGFEEELDSSINWKLLSQEDV